VKPHSYPHRSSAQRGARIALAALALAAFLAACSKPAPAPEPVRAVKLIQIGETPVTAQSEFAGDVRARVEQTLAFRVGGKMLSRSVEQGQRIKAGQAIAQLDAQDLQLGAQAAGAQVRAAQTQVDLASADFKRFKELREQGFVSNAVLEQRDAQLKAATAQLDQARAQASLQGNQTGYTKLLAPAAGVVTAVFAEGGQVVGAGSPVVRVALDGPRDAVFSVPEDRIKELSLGSEVSVRTVSGDKLSGKVREIAAAADPVTRTFGVRVAIDGAAPSLGSTIYATPAALSAGGATALKLPSSAVREVGGKSAVWVFDPASSTLKSRPVQITTADGNDVVLEPGALKTGELVVRAGVHVLQEGQKVTRYNGAASAAVNSASAAK
jgi:membrane fusion protein, multidrug efflux system